MIPISLKHLNPLWKTATSGSFGVPARWKHCPGGQSYKRSQIRLASPNLQGGSRHHFRCQRRGVMPQTLKMTIQCFPPLTVLTGMHSCPLTPCDLAAKPTTWNNHKNPGICQGIAALVHQLVECVWELRETVEPLTMFTDAEVFGNDVPSNWVKITSSRTYEPTEPTTSQEQSHSQNRRVCAQGSFMVANNVGRSKPITTTQMASTSPAPPCDQKVPPPSFAEIKKSLWGTVHHVYQ